MDPKDVAWEVLTALVETKRAELLAQLRALDEWYGELNVLLSSEDRSPERYGRSPEDSPS